MSKPARSSRRPIRVNRLAMVVAIFCVGVVGSVLLFRSLAAGQYIVVQPEGSGFAGSASKVSDSNASGGSYVLLGRITSSYNRIEAENTTHTVRVVDLPGASGNQILGYFYEVGHSMTATVSAPSAGSYALRIRYGFAKNEAANPSTLTRSLVVNGQQVSAPDFTITSNVINKWDDPSTHQTKDLGSVSLNQGNNTITLRIDDVASAYPWDVDYLEIAGASGGTSPTPAPGPTPPPPPPTSGEKLPSTVRIMTFGDSITYGANYVYAYRERLDQLLQTVGGHTYTFVGSEFDGVYHHEGHGGWCVDVPCWATFLDAYQGWVRSNPSDLLIMNGGVNDLFTGHSVEAVQTSMQKLVDGMFTELPNVFIVLQPVAHDGGPVGDQITYNNWMKNFVAERRAQGQRIYFADTTGVTTGFDNVHPDQAGYEAFAQIIFDVIKPLL